MMKLIMMMMMRFLLYRNAYLKCALTWKRINKTVQYYEFINMINIYTYTIMMYITIMYANKVISTPLSAHTLTIHNNNKQLQGH